MDRNEIDDADRDLGFGTKVASEARQRLLNRDGTFSQTVHSRTSYRADEVLWHARFADPFDRPPGGPITLDVRRIHDIEQLGGATLENADAKTP